MGNEIVKVCRQCGNGIVDCNKLKCVKCDSHDLVKISSSRRTSIRSIRKVCSSCGRSTRRKKRSVCKTCQGTTFIAIQQKVPRRRSSSFFWSASDSEDNEESSRRKTKKLLLSLKNSLTDKDWKERDQEKKRKKKQDNLLFSLKKSLTDRDAFETIEKNVEKNNQKIEENIGEYSSDSDSEIEEIEDWLDEDTLASSTTNSTTIPNTPKKRRSKRLSKSISSYFEQFPIGIRETVLKALNKECFKPGETIVSQGDEGDRRMYVILDGEASISVRDDESGKERLITHIYKGDYFGETSLIYGVRRTATVRAVSKVNCSVLTHQKYCEMPRFRSFLALSKCDITKNFSDDQKLAICSCLVPVEFQKGDYIIREKDTVKVEENAFFMITNGEVEVLDMEHGHLVNLRVGHSFGEMALVNDRPRNASVRVVSKFVTCMALSKTNFLNALSTDDGKQILREKLVESTRHLEVVRETRKLKMRQSNDDVVDSSLYDIVVVGEGGGVVGVDEDQEEEEEEEAEEEENHDNVRSPTPPSPPPPPQLKPYSSVQLFKQRSESYVEIMPTKRSPRRRVGSAKNVNEYRVMKTLGTGSFADVKLVQHGKTGKDYAMKCLKRPRRTFTSSNATNDIKLEIKIMRLLEHVNIVKLFDVIEDERYIYLIQELCDGGSIMPDAESPDGATRLSDKIARKYTRQIVRALEYMHECGVIHRDLKPQNVLLKHGDVKICDFGTACIISQGETLMVCFFSLMLERDSREHRSFFLSLSLSLHIHLLVHTHKSYIGTQRNTRIHGT